MNAAEDELEQVGEPLGTDTGLSTGDPDQFEQYAYGFGDTYRAALEHAVSGSSGLPYQERERYTDIALITEEQLVNGEHLVVIGYNRGLSRIGAFLDDILPGEGTSSGLVSDITGRPMTRL